MLTSFYFHDLLLTFDYPTSQKSETVLRLSLRNAKLEAALRSLL